MHRPSLFTLHPSRTSMRLTQRTRPPCLVDAAPLTPEGLAGKSRAEIERIALQGWNQTFAVGELFRLTGDDAQDLTLADLDGSLLRVGAGMTSGTLTITGHAGDYAGEQLRGGTLTIRGTAGDYLGAGMRSGNIT